MEKKYNKGDMVQMLQLLDKCTCLKQIATNDRNSLRSLLKAGNIEISQLLYSQRKKADMLLLQKDLRQIINKLKNAQSASISQQSSTQQAPQQSKQPKVQEKWLGQIIQQMSKNQKHAQGPIPEQKQNQKFSSEDKKQKLLQIKKEQQKRELQQFQSNSQKQQDQIQQRENQELDPSISESLKSENTEKRITEEKTDNEKYSEEQKESLQEYTQSQSQTDDIQIIEQEETKNERHHYTIDYINELLTKSQEAIRSSQLQYETINNKLDTIKEHIESLNLQSMNQVKKEEFFLSFNPNTNFKSDKLKQFISRDVSYDSKIIQEIINGMKIDIFSVEDIFQDLFSGNSMSRVSQSYFIMKIQVYCFSFCQTIILRIFSKQEIQKQVHNWLEKFFQLRILSYFLIIYNLELVQR